MIPSPGAAVDADPAVGRLTSGAGLPDLACLGPHLRTPFRVRRATDARVLWLNQRWLFERGVDAADPDAIREIEAWLLREFAVTAAPDGEARLYADRYGNSNGAYHGGSGRSGISGAFNGKGVGQTPFASPRGGWEHAHGFLALDEALREIVSSEIAAAELPHGAVPVLAVIDLGGEFLADASGHRARRCVLVRPNFVRPAHAERSVFYGDSGAPGSDQQIDALRVRDVVRFLTGPLEARQAAGVPFISLEETFTRIARQIGHAWAHRLWLGIFDTQNVSVDGALLDFGSFRAAPSWRRATGKFHEQFGGERRLVETAVESLAFYFAKYGGGRADADSHALMRRADEAMFAAFFDACLLGLGVRTRAGDAAAQEAADLLGAHMARAQKRQIEVGLHKRRWRKPWLFEAITGAGPAAPDERATGERLTELLQVLNGDRGMGGCAGHHIAAAVRWLTPRPFLYYEVAAPRARHLVRHLTGDAAGDRAAVARYVTQTIARCRRVWPDMPETFTAVAQGADPTSSAVYGLDWRTGAPHVWCEASHLEGRVRVAGRWRRLEELEDRLVHRRDGSIGLYAPLIGRSQAALARGDPLELPPPQFVFRWAARKLGWPTDLPLT